MPHAPAADRSAAAETPPTQSCLSQSPHADPVSTRAPLAHRCSARLEHSSARPSVPIASTCRVVRLRSQCRIPQHAYGTYRCTPPRAPIRAGAPALPQPAQSCPQGKIPPPRYSRSKSSIHLSPDPVPCSPPQSPPTFATTPAPDRPRETIPDAAPDNPHTKPEPAQSLREMLQSISSEK